MGRGGRALTWTTYALGDLVALHATPVHAVEPSAADRETSRDPCAAGMEALDATGPACRERSS